MKLPIIRIFLKVPQTRNFFLDLAHDLSEESGCKEPFIPTLQLADKSNSAIITRRHVEVVKYLDPCTPDTTIVITTAVVDPKTIRTRLRKMVNNLIKVATTQASTPDLTLDTPRSRCEKVALGIPTESLLPGIIGKLVGFAQYGSGVVNPDTIRVAFVPWIHPRSTSKVPLLPRWRWMTLGLRRDPRSNIITGTISILPDGPDTDPPPRGDAIIAAASVTYDAVTITEHGTPDNHRYLADLLTAASMLAATIKTTSDTAEAKRSASAPLP